MEVTGRDRVHFFRRPILPNTTPLPYIRYAREISLDVADVKRRDRLKEEAGIKRVTINEPISPTKVIQNMKHLFIYIKSYYKATNHLILIYILISNFSLSSIIEGYPEIGKIRESLII